METVADFESYAALRGASRQGFGDAGLHRGSNRQSRIARERNIKLQCERDTALAARRAELLTEYEAEVAAGQIKVLSRTERLILTANGHEDNESVQAARRVCDRTGIDWRNDK